MHEKIPNQEFSERELRLIALFREKGPEDPEAREMFNAWCKEEEAKATTVGTPRANIETEFRRAKFYRAVGGYDSAYDALETIREAALADPLVQDFYEKAMVVMDEIDVERKELGL